MMAYLLGAWTAFQFLEGILAASADVSATIHDLVGLVVTVAMLLLMIKCEKRSNRKAKNTD